MLIPSLHVPWPKSSKIQLHFIAPRSTIPKRTATANAANMQPKGSQSKQTEDVDSVLADFDDRDADAGFDGPGPYQEKMLDADFFNAFPDDFDESDMEVPQ